LPLNYKAMNEAEQIALCIEKIDAQNS